MSVETAQIKESLAAESELDQPIWSVISFERVEAANLDHSSAVRLISDLEAKGISGLCIVTEEAAARIKTPE